MPKEVTDMSELSGTAKLARKALKILFLPAVALVIISRVTPFSWYWVDLVTVGLLVLVAILAVVGRIFTSTDSNK